MVVDIKALNKCNDNTNIAIDENIIKDQIAIKSIKSLISREKMEAYNKKFEGNIDEILGPSLLTLANRVSSPRENMFIQQLPQHLMVLEPETPDMFTGYEHEVGKYSRSYYRTDRSMSVVDKISRFESHPNLKYLIITKDAAGRYDVIERESHKHLTENYGYMINNSVIDSIQNPGTVIPKDTVLHKSTAFDDNMNYRYGKNVNMIFMSIPEVIGDAIVLSRSCAESFKYITVKHIEVSKNTNEVLINLYGNGLEYKSLPNMNEATTLGVICAKRKMVNKTMLYNLRNTSLRNIHMDEDDVYYSDGVLVDIDVFCNKKIDEIEETPANSQILNYWREQTKYYKRVKSVLGKIITSNPGKCSDRLLYIYHRAEDMTSNRSFVNNSSKFEDMVIKMTVVEINHADIGYKLTGRFGEKGVIGNIWDDDKMPINEYGERVHMIASPKGSFGRLNLGQWSEQELSFLSTNIARDLRINNIPYVVGLPKILEYITDVNAEYGLKIAQLVQQMSPVDQESLYNSMLTEGIKMLQPPFKGNVGFEEFRNKLYKKYPYPRYRFTIEGDPVINPLTAGKKYVMLMKQTPPSKYSSRSLGMSSTIGHPAKSSKYKNKNIPKSDTPIRVGEMELNNLGLMNDSKGVARFMSMVANSPEDCEIMVSHFLTTDNVYDIDNIPIKQDNVNRKMLNAYMKCGGSMLVE